MGKRSIAGRQEYLAAPENQPVQSVRYWWECAKQASRGTASFANDWQWLFGIPIVTGAAGGFFASFLASRGVGVIMQKHPVWSAVLSGLLAAFGAFIITWFVAFLRRLIRTPAEIDHEKSKIIGNLEQELKTFREPNLLIDYRPQEGEPFVQHLNNITQYRVSVRSPVPIPDAELEVNHIKIGELPMLSKLHLRPMHDRNPGGTKRVRLKADKEDYWDLVSAHISGVRLTCISSLEQILPPGNYEFELMASGGDRPAITKIVKLQVYKDNTVTLGIHDGQFSTRRFT